MVRFRFKIFEPKPCRNRLFRTVPNWNREKMPKNHETMPEPQKTGGSEPWRAVKKLPENCRFQTETKTGGFGTGSVTAKHPRGFVPVQQFPKPEPAVPNRNRWFLNCGHLYLKLSIMINRERRRRSINCRAEAYLDPSKIERWNCFAAAMDLPNDQRRPSQ